MQKIMMQLHTVTGFPKLPPFASLGFHFSKWENTDAQKLIGRLDVFDKYAFPVDVLWLDIQWCNWQNSGAYEFFRFNPANFKEPDLIALKSKLAEKGRKMTVILDPHLKVSKHYSIYQQAVSLESQNKDILVKKQNGNSFVGRAWPGNSVWIDFLSENAQMFWMRQFDYSQFKGSNRDVWAWNDMNEPSVFDSETSTLPLNTLHNFEGKQIEHREIHNAYGALMMRSTFGGLLLRDKGAYRPFVLTRSFFFGSHQFGAYWTGDNTATFAELQGSLTQVLQMAMSGFAFGGADIPGFRGTPSDDLFICFYQLGRWFPFMRAHSHLDDWNREPML